MTAQIISGTELSKKIKKKSNLMLPVKLNIIVLKVNVHQDLQSFWWGQILLLKFMWAVNVKVAKRLEWSRNPMIYLKPRQRRNYYN